MLRSWGKGMFKITHAIRVDPRGNVWTVDAASSLVFGFTPEGKKLMEISVGEQPDVGASLAQRSCGAESLRVAGCDEGDEDEQGIATTSSSPEPRASEPLAERTP